MHYFMQQCSTVQSSGSYPRFLWFPFQSSMISWLNRVVLHPRYIYLYSTRQGNLVGTAFYNILMTKFVLIISLSESFNSSFQQWKSDKIKIPFIVFNEAPFLNNRKEMIWLNHLNVFGLYRVQSQEWSYFTNISPNFRYLIAFPLGVTERMKITNNEINWEGSGFTFVMM